MDEDTVAEYFRTAFENVWLADERVVAVTPFILNYQSDPFLEFSWQKFQTNDFYRQYYAVQSLAKIKAEPEQIEKGKIDFAIEVYSALENKNKLLSLGDKCFKEKQF